MRDKEHTNIKNAAAILLLSIANADEKIDKDEIKSIRDIIQDFFSIESEETFTIIEDAILELKQKTSLFSYIETINDNFSYKDKVDFLLCIYEVAYSNQELHFMEQYLIRKIANSLHVEHKDLIEAKIEIKKYL
ncbi:TerB family tellurite resistance protein [Candidatus Marinimicrobia bacterium]|nr:TerB family tellurite resistance protein [Candidatus Neomarinimicrobiota bacterium]